MVSPFLLSLTTQLPRSGRTVHGPARPSRRPPTPRLRGPPTPMVGILLSRRLMMVRAARRARRGTLGWLWLRRRVGCRAAHCGEYQQGSHGERYQLLLHVIHLLSHIGSGHRPVLAATQRRGRSTGAVHGPACMSRRSTHTAAAWAAHAHAPLYYCPSWCTSGIWRTPHGQAAYQMARIMDINHLPAPRQPVESPQAFYTRITARMDVRRLLEKLAQR
jgi:hypothetical protein